MRILGIAPDVWISSATLIEDGVVVAAAPEERFNRQKMSMAFPTRAINFCLKEAGCTLDALDAIAVAWNPGVHLRSPSGRFINNMRWRGEYLIAVPGGLQGIAGEPEIEGVEQLIRYSRNREQKIIYVDHHTAHAASAFFFSPFEEAAILTADGRGELKTTTWNYGKGATIDELQSVDLPHSLGILYSALTEFLGFRPHSDEWKVMALAALGRPGNEYIDKVRSLVTFLPQGRFELALSYFRHYLFDKQPTLYSAKCEALLGPARIPDTELGQRHHDIALGLQTVFEETFQHMLHGLHNLTNSTNLAIAGGAAMNSVYNGKILDSTPFASLFIPSFPDDTGVSLGAASYVGASLDPEMPRHLQTHNFWGPEYGNEEIENLLKSAKLSYEFLENPCEEAATMLCQGKLIAWFQGRMEYGQRALGNRSILGDPRFIETRDLINAAVKFREMFRPFAPAILEEDAGKYFELPEGTTVPFMEKVYPVKASKRDEIPAVVHFDGSGRLQTVNVRTNPLFHKLITAFKRQTGVPVVLNTSFNVNGEPIVATPTDAIRTFYACGLDVLIMGNYLIAKG